MKLPTDPASTLFALVTTELLLLLAFLSSLGLYACVTLATMALAIVDISLLEIVAKEYDFVSLLRIIDEYLHFYHC